MHWHQGLSVEEYLEATNSDNEEESDEDEIYIPPTETYREDYCVICLEEEANILYFGCGHIAVCDRCDRSKKTGRKNCDVCRSEILERIKIYY